MLQKESDTYLRLQPMGKDWSGGVYLCLCKKDNAVCVIKEIELNNLDEEEKKLIRKEFSLLSQFQHDFILGYREVYETVKGKLCLVMDYAEDGDLSQYIKNHQNKGYIQESLILEWFIQMSLAVKYCHDRNIIHRNIKPSKFLFTKHLKIQLADFSLARRLKKEMKMEESIVCTPHYLAPELIAQEKYSLKVDVWGLGVVLYELCTLKPPFQGENIKELALNILKCSYEEIPNHYSWLLKSLVKQLLQPEPSARPSIDEILKLPYPTRKENLMIRKEFHCIYQPQKILIDNKNIRCVVDHDFEEQSSQLIIKKKLNPQLLQKGLDNLHQKRQQKNSEIKLQDASKEQLLQLLKNQSENSRISSDDLVNQINRDNIEIRSELSYSSNSSELFQQDQEKQINFQNQEEQFSLNSNSQFDQIQSQQQQFNFQEDSNIFKYSNKSSFFELTFQKSIPQNNKVLKAHLLEGLPKQCQKLNCCKKQITKICTYSGCQKYLYLCDSFYCQIDHQEHLDQVQQITEALQLLPSLIDAQQKIQQQYDILIKEKMQEFFIALEELIKIRDTPIFQSLDQKPAKVENWDAQDWNNFLLNFSQIDQSEKELEDFQANAKIEQLKSVNVQGLVEKLSIQTHQLNPLDQLFQSRELLTSFEKSITISPDLCSENHQKLKKNNEQSFKPKQQTKSHHLLYFQEANCNSKLKVLNNNKEILLPLEVKNINILPQNLLQMFELTIELFFELEGTLGNGNNKFGLFCGSLLGCTYKEKYHISNLFIMSDNGKYSLQGEIGENDQFRLQNKKCQLGLLYDKQKGLATFTNLELQSNFTFPLEINCQELYFCLILSTGGTKVKII